MTLGPPLAWDYLLLFFASNAFSLPFGFLLFLKMIGYAMLVFTLLLVESLKTIPLGSLNFFAAPSLFNWLLLVVVLTTFGHDYKLLFSSKVVLVALVQSVGILVLLGPLKVKLFRSPPSFSIWLWFKAYDLIRLCLEGAGGTITRVMLLWGGCKSLSTC